MESQVYTGITTSWTKTKQRVFAKSLICYSQIHYLKQSPDIRFTRILVKPEQLIERRSVVHTRWKQITPFPCFTTLKNGILISGNQQQQENNMRQYIILTVLYLKFSFKTFKGETLKMLFEIRVGFVLFHDTWYK